MGGPRQLTDIAVGISLQSCDQTEINVFQVYIPPSWIFHYRFIPVQSYNIATIPIRLLDPQNIGEAVVISLLSCVQAEIYAFQVNMPHLDFPLPVVSGKPTIIVTIDMAVH